MGGSAVPDGVVSKTPGTGQTECLRGLSGLLLCVIGALEHDTVPIYFGSGGTDGGNCASGSVWDVLKLLCPPHGQCASTEVRAKLSPCFLLRCSAMASALWPKPILELP